MIIVFFLSVIVLIAALLYIINKRFPLEGPFEVSNLFGRILMISILVAAAFMAIQRMSARTTVAR